MIRVPGGARFARESPVQLGRALRESREDCLTALLGAVVLDPQLDAAVRRRDRNDHTRRGPAAHGLVERVAHDLVERRLGAFAEVVAGSDVDLELNAPPDGVAFGQLPECRRKAELAERVGLDPADDLPQVDAGLARHVERPLDDLHTARDIARRDRPVGCVEHLCHRGHELHRAVVDQFRQAAAFVALGP